MPGADFRHAGELYLRWFVELGSLTPDEAVLEPGCGTGRMAEPLTRYLGPAGSYDGFDVVSTAVDWCESNIASKHPNFHFRHVDVLNHVYNPEGRLDPEAFEFPYPDEAFDFAFLTSVFTHMRPPEVRHYLGQIRRVLRPGGRCLMTFFLLNEESLDAARAGRAKRRFALRGRGSSMTYPRSRRRRSRISRRTSSGSSSRRASSSICRSSTVAGPVARARLPARTWSWSSAPEDRAS